MPPKLKKCWGGKPEEASLKCCATPGTGKPSRGKLSIIPDFGIANYPTLLTLSTFRYSEKMFKKPLL
jgi:hypothetical protein